MGVVRGILDEAEREMAAGRFDHTEAKGVCSSYYRRHCFGSSKGPPRPQRTSQNAAGSCSIRAGKVRPGAVASCCATWRNIATPSSA